MKNILFMQYNHDGCASYIINEKNFDWVLKEMYQKHVATKEEIIHAGYISFWDYKTETLPCQVDDVVRVFATV